MRTASVHVYLQQFYSQNILNQVRFSSFRAVSVSHQLIQLWIVATEYWTSFVHSQRCCPRRHFVSRSSQTRRLCCLRWWLVIWAKALHFHLIILAGDYHRQRSISGDPAAKYSSRSCSIKNSWRDRSAKKLFVPLSFQRMICRRYPERKRLHGGWKRLPGRPKCSADKLQLQWQQIIAKPPRGKHFQSDIARSLSALIAVTKKRHRFGFSQILAFWKIARTPVLAADASYNNYNSSWIFSSAKLLEHPKDLHCSPEIVKQILMWLDSC